MDVETVMMFLHEIRRLQAEENLASLDRAWVGGGLLKKHVSQRLINRWRKEADLGTGEKPVNPKQDARALAGMGIGVRTVSNANR